MDHRDSPTLQDVRRQLDEAAVAADAAPMAAYMKHRFTFLGVKTPARRAATAETLRWARRADADVVLDFVDGCWSQPEREFHYVGADAAKVAHASFDPGHLTRLRRLITTNSWWDTVDSLASWPVGSVVDRHRAAADVMDRWVGSDDIWTTRTAILHQLRFGETTDVERLERYALLRAGDTEFFIRKAIGWALRTYGRVEPGRVRAFVDRHHDDLSGLTRREALKHLS